MVIDMKLTGLPPLCATYTNDVRITLDPATGGHTALLPDGKKTSGKDLAALKRSVETRLARAACPSEPAVSAPGPIMEPIEIPLLAIDSPAAHLFGPVFNPVRVSSTDKKPAVEGLTVRIAQPPAAVAASITAYKNRDENWRRSPPRDKLLLHPDYLTAPAIQALSVSVVHGLLSQAYADTTTALARRWWDSLDAAGDTGVCWDYAHQPSGKPSISRAKDGVTAPWDLPRFGHAIQTSSRWETAVLPNQIPEGFVPLPDGSLERQGVRVIMDITGFAPHFSVASDAYPGATLYSSRSLPATLLIAVATADVLARNPVAVEEWHAQDAAWFKPSRSLSRSFDLPPSWPKRARVLSGLVLESPEDGGGYRGLSSLFFGSYQVTGFERTHTPVVAAGPAWHPIEHDRKLFFRPASQPDTVDTHAMTQVLALHTAYQSALLSHPQMDFKEATAAFSDSIEQLLAAASKGTLVTTATLEQTLSRMDNILRDLRATAENAPVVLAFSQQCKAALDAMPQAPARSGPLSAPSRQR